jgi:octaprenyl-diphosphate synthase
MSLSQSKAVLELFETNYRAIRAELEQVERRLQRELRSEDPFVDELVRYGFRLGGKRLRPALVLLSGKAFGKTQENHLRLAAAVEMIHTASLIHDDILDGALVRRHLATINSRWSNEASVMAGDLLFTRALRMATESEDLFAIRTLSEACSITCEGELRQISRRGNFEMSQKEYLEIIRAKTAALLAACCRLGAHYAGAGNEGVARLGRFGEELGIAFQIADDILDLSGEESAMGKTLGTDLSGKKATLPLLHFLEVADDDRRQEVLDMFQETPEVDTKLLLEWMNECGSLDYARKTAEDYVQSAIASLDELPATDARDGLKMIAAFVVSRHR